MKKACVVGHFGFGEDLLNGQTIKTKVFTAELEKYLGKDQVMTVDTHGGKVDMLRAMLKTVGAFFTCENILILPAHNGIRYLGPLCVAVNSLFRRKIHYVVIGGWLPDFLEGKNLEKTLKKFTGIYVETGTMQEKMVSKGFTNTTIMPNFKQLEPLASEELHRSTELPHKLCIFSRVMREKGIEEAMEVVRHINEKNGQIVYTLDIFGQVDPEQIEWFDELKKRFPEYVAYGGVVPFDQSVQTLKKYFALLFPTGFYTEGVPGTILDAYAAGLPVISSRWESFNDVVEDGVTGIGYTFGDNEALREVLEKIQEDPSLIDSKREACVRKMDEFSPERAISVLKL